MNNFSAYKLNLYKIFAESERDFDEWADDSDFSAVDKSSTGISSFLNKTRELSKKIGNSSNISVNNHMQNDYINKSNENLASHCQETEISLHVNSKIIKDSKISKNKSNLSKESASKSDISNEDEHAIVSSEEGSESVTKKLNSDYKNKLSQVPNDPKTIKKTKLSDNFHSNSEEPPKKQFKSEVDFYILSYFITP